MAIMKRLTLMVSATLTVAAAAGPLPRLASGYTGSREPNPVPRNAVHRHQRWNPGLLGLRQRIVYQRSGQRQLTLYLFTPEQAAATGRPVVIYIHGGGLRFGSAKINGAMTAHNRLLVQVERRFIREGMDFASVNYRLAPMHPWPIPLDDVKHAVRFLDQHTNGLGIEPKCMVVMGDSAGGELASFVGLTMTKFDTRTSVVRGVVDLFGPTDRQPFAQLWWIRHGLTPNPVYGVYTPGRVENESVVSHVHADAPPFLIVQGTRDQVVPPGQSALLRDRLEQVGVPVQEVLVHHAGHELVSVDQKPVQPTLGQVAATINRFVIASIGADSRQYDIIRPRR